MEQTRLNGVTYLLVADSEEDDAECLILKDTSAPEEKDSVYEMVEEEVELNAVLKVFEELLEDVEIESVDGTVKRIFLTDKNGVRTQRRTRILR